MKSRLVRPSRAAALRFAPVLAILAAATALAAVGCTGTDPALAADTSADDPDAGSGSTGNAAGFDLAATASITLVQGASVDIDVTLTRTSFAGPITVSVTGLPDGVIPAPLVVPAGATTAKLSLSSLPTAAQGSKPITLAASSADGTLHRERPASLLVRGIAGGVDTTFGAAGIVTTAVGSGGIAARSLALQPDGRVLVGGSSDNDFVAVRLAENGALDTSYGGTGAVTVDLKSGGMASVDSAEAVALSPTGEAVLAGYRANGMENTYGLVRLTSAGKPDTTFDDDGYATPSFAMPDANSQLAYGVTVAPNGRIVIAGSVFPNGATTTEAIVARFKSNGAPDDAFGNGNSGFFYGHSTSAAGTNDNCEAVTVLADGKLLAACNADDGGTHPVALRLLDDGQVDAAFGPSASGFSPVPLFGATAHSAHALADGRVLLTGETADGKMFVVRLQSNGIVDTSFGPNGAVLVDLGAKVVGVRSVLDGSGRLVLAAGLGADQDLVVARLDAAGKLDTTFTAAGFVVTKVGAKVVGANARIALAPDGRIVAVTNTEALAPKLVAVRLWN